MRRSLPDGKRPAAAPRREPGLAYRGSRVSWGCIRDSLRCEVLSGEDRLDSEVDTVLASDAMSVVLAALYPGACLLTGLTNIQSVRTAHVADLAGLVYVRGSRPGEAAVHFARQKDMVVLVTPLGMFESCGILHGLGLRGAV